MSAVNDPTPAGGPPQPTAPAPDAVQTSPSSPAATGIQTAPPPDATVPLPPRPRIEPITVEELGRAMTRLDRMLVVLVLVLACLVSLFPVRNSDFWLHLATARDWLGGKIALGEDAYSYTGKGTWVNHSWLYDVLVYGLYQLPGIGGPAVVIAKAVVIVALTVLMLSIRRRGQSIWIPAVCTALAVLAMSPRLLLQPTILSFALLGVTLAVLMRRELRDEPEEERKRRPAGPVPWLGEPADRPLWLLVPLFALWVNLDSWFILGPLAVGLYLAGQLAQAFFSSGKPDAPRPGIWRPLAAVLAAGVAACLLSPFGVHGLNLPAEIGAGDVLTILRRDDEFNRFLCSPLQREYFSRPDLGLNIAGMAYYPLIVLGLASFAVNSSHWRWGRTLLWAGFLVLSVAYVRAVPFFAIVAGPITAVNFQDYAARRFGTSPVTVGWWKEWSLLGRALSVLAALALVVLAWPGWLFGFPRESRRVGVVAEPPPGMAKLAAQIDEWRSDGTLTEEDRLLNLQPEVANSLTWLCPDHRLKWFFDFRFDNYPPEVAEDYVKLRRAFDPVEREGKSGGLAANTKDWLPILRDRQISCIIVYDANGATFQLRRARCDQGAEYLVNLYQDGHGAVYARREVPVKPESNPYLTWLGGLGLPPAPVDQGRFRGKEFDPWSLAFGPKAESLPDVKPRRPQPLAWWARFYPGPGARPPEAADAAAYLAYADDAALRYHYEQVMLPQAKASFCALVSASPVHMGNALADATAFGFQFNLALNRRPPISTDDFGPVLLTPLAPVMLGVRSARRAIQRNPDDAEAYHYLGRAYVMLSRQTEEQNLASGLALLTQLRNVQAIAALRNAVLIDPDQGLAHLWLSILFGRQGFADLQLKHRTEWLRWLRQTGRQGGETEEQFNERKKLLQDSNDKLEKLVKDNQNKYEVQSEKKPVLQKAEIALRLRLGEKALQVLLDSDSLEFGKAGARLELDLLLKQGRLEELREQLVPSKDEKLREKLPDDLNSELGAGTYEMYRFLLAAAEGDYKEADEFLEQARTKTFNDPAQRQGFRKGLELERGAPGPAKDLDVAQLVALGVGKAVLEQCPTGGGLPYQLEQRIARDLRLAVLFQMVQPLHTAANYETLRGVMKLEAGDIPGAQERFRQVLFNDKDKKGKREDVVLEFRGADAAYRYLRLTEEKE
jgi:hypothetical protein